MNGPVPYFRFKAALVAVGAVSVFVAGNEAFPSLWRACAGATGAGSGALLAYLLKTTEPKP